MFYFTVQAETDRRPRLYVYDSSQAATVARAGVLADLPKAIVGDVFEAPMSYIDSFPHVIGVVTNMDGSSDLLWSDDVRTPVE